MLLGKLDPNKFSIPHHESENEIKIRNLTGIIASLLREVDKNGIPNTKDEFYEKLGIESVIVSDKVTIVNLKNGYKGVARCDKHDTQDLEVGFALAYMLAISTKGNKTKYKKLVKELI